MLTHARTLTPHARTRAAIDRAIGRDGLKVVTLLRLSPLLPLAASNYLYGLTSVPLKDYMLGSFLGMLPGERCSGSGWSDRDAAGRRYALNHVPLPAT